MLRTAIWFIYFFIYLIVISPGLIKAKRLKDQGKMEEFHAYIRTKYQNWARRLVKLAGGRVHIKGQELIPKDEPVLIVSNHQGNFDIPILLGYLDLKIGFISKKEVKKIPMIGKWMEYMGCVFMDRKDRRQAVKSIIEGADKLQNGYNLVVFPEGTRSKGGPVASFKKGTFKLATKSNVTILPVTIEGSYNMMEANKNKITPADVYVTISEPIRIHQHSSVDGQDLADQTQAQIVSKMNNNE
ncbi:1-acyl-sn-glycerol-3-phosphate acyltransferase [Salipaludibacillus keqinensis]|uniref:1-acyl-sn-glycerol-3-phosphate acyltransferase n=1 Tax=Salipaludibacillus keqinensis TaxID=2045207 RepID=A0A323TFR6_9BACI|nr:lysophospholipid acyltransferase family protein [Salipaludibacillus keqinensis]PYZ92457.1 1-acyl-sn-glycerol-3-phosphate acyltransferase [Salipaludibacillus keqinensis]